VTRSVAYVLETLFILFQPSALHRWGWSLVRFGTKTLPQVPLSTVVMWGPSSVGK